MTHVIRGRIQEPIYRLENQFWPDRNLMLQEALALREANDMFNDTPVPKIWEDDNKQATIKTLPLDEYKTPYLKQMFEGFTEMYGDFGNVNPNYFFIEPEWEYGWHVDTKISKWMTGSSVLCAMNIVLTDDQTPAEFQGWGERQYTACMFNTSVVHRVQTHGTLRILARITFRDFLYEEIVHRMKRIDKRNK